MKIKVKKQNKDLICCFIIKIFNIFCFVFIWSNFFVITNSQAFVLNNTLQDGRLIQGKLKSGERLFYNGKEIKAFTDGTFYFGIPHSAVSPITLILQKEEKKFPKVYHFTPRLWPSEIINGLPKNKVRISIQNQKRIQKESSLLKAERQKFSDAFFPVCFSRPVQEYRLSGNFGAQRVLNGIKQSGHSGTDYAAPIGTPVYASADGTVVIAHSNMFLTGQTVLINHGYGLFSSYSHLSQTDVLIGDIIKRGAKIGEIGQTGRATGPHLHFSFFWYETRVDPELVFTDFPCLK